MLTEEKLQNFLDDLRLGKYDNERYEIIPSLHNISIKDRDNDVTTFIGVSSKADKWQKVHTIWENRCKIWKWLFREPNYYDYSLTYFGYAYDYSNFCTISKSLFESFEVYCKELVEKDKLVKRSNIESLFGL